MTFLGTFFILSLLLLPFLWLGCALTDYGSDAHYGWRGAYAIIYLSVFFIGVYLATTPARTGVVNDIAAVIVVLILVSSWKRS